MVLLLLCRFLEWFDINFNFLLLCLGEEVSMVGGWIRCVGLGWGRGFLCGKMMLLFEGIIVMKFEIMIGFDFLERRFGLLRNCFCFWMYCFLLILWDFVIGGEFWIGLVVVNVCFNLEWLVLGCWGKFVFVSFFKVFNFLFLIFFCDFFCDCFFCKMFI